MEDLELVCSHLFIGYAPGITGALPNDAYPFINKKRRLLHLERKRYVKKKNKTFPMVRI